MRYINLSVDRSVKLPDRETLATEVTWDLVERFGLLDRRDKIKARLLSTLKSATAYLKELRDTGTIDGQVGQSLIAVLTRLGVLYVPGQRRQSA